MSLPHVGGDRDDPPETPTVSSRWARLARHLYTVGWWLALPLVMLYLLKRSWRQPAYRQHWPERMGFVARSSAFAEAGGGPTGSNTATQRPEAQCPVIWVHAVSVGETRAAQPLIERLLASYPDHRILLTHMTPTGRETSQTLFGDRVGRCYLPYDIPSFIARFLGRIRPVLGLVMETELWPNLVAGSRAAGVPLLLVNARLSEKSLAKGQRSRALIMPALSGLSAVVAQTEPDARRLNRLGRRDVPVVGNIKFDIEPDPLQLARGRAWRMAIGRPVVLLASSRPGEEREILQAWAQIGRPATVLAIVPRHPQRFDEVRELMAEFAAQAASAAQAATTLLSRADLAAGQGGSAGLVLGDSMGEMFAWYSMADVVIMGGTLQPFGGQNLIEPCACGKPVVVGPSLYNFEEVGRQALQAGAARQVDSAQAALTLAGSLLDDPDQLAAMSQAGSAFAAAHRGATGRTLQIIDRWLSVMPPRTRA